MTQASRRFQVLSIFAAYGVAGIYWGAYFAALPALQETSGLGDARFGLLVSSVTVGGILGMNLLGRHLHRAQAWAIPACLTLMGLSQLLLAAAGGPLGIAVALLAIGAASGALDISLNMRVARIETDFGIRLFNRVHALFPFTMLVASASVGLLRGAGATPATIFPSIVLLFLVAAAAERHAGRHQTAAEGIRTGGRLNWSPVLVALGVLAALGALMEGGAGAWAAIYLERELGAGPAFGGFAAAAITLGLTAGRLAAHHLEDRMRDMAILRSFALLSLPAFAVLALVPHPAAALCAFFLAGFGTGPIEPAIFRSVTRRHPEAVRGTALARATALAYTGYLLSAPALGRSIEAAGWPATWGLLAVLGIAASLLSLRVPPAPRP